ncbi:MAG: hypothetical protein ACKO0Z_22390 [Betaproteobacteria bacterium]
MISKRDNAIHVRLDENIYSMLRDICDLHNKEVSTVAAELLSMAVVARHYVFSKVAERYAATNLAAINRDS